MSLSNSTDVKGSENIEEINFDYFKTNCFGCGRFKEQDRCPHCTLEIKFEMRCNNCLLETNKCVCFIHFICVICNSVSRYSNLKLCCFCLGYTKNNICERCFKITPRDWSVCEKCIPAKRETSKFLMNIPNYYKRQKRIFCNCTSCNKKFLSNNESFCKSCKGFGKKCFNCKSILNGLSCENCKEVSVPSFVLSAEIRDAEGWECFFCNYRNEFKILVCERCNHSKEYFIGESVFCQFCKNKSSDSMCKSCYWITNCGVCKKRMYPTQSIFCRKCGSKAERMSCSKCDKDFKSSEIMCVICKDSEGV